MLWPTSGYFLLPITMHVSSANITFPISLHCSENTPLRFDPWFAMYGQRSWQIKRKFIINSRTLNNALLSHNKWRQLFAGIFMRTVREEVRSLLASPICPYLPKELLFNDCFFVLEFFTKGLSSHQKLKIYNVEGW